jgi:hypothetical protein
MFSFLKDLGSKMADMNLADGKEYVVSQENQYLSNLLTEAQTKNTELQVNIPVSSYRCDKGQLESDAPVDDVISA